MTLAQQVENVVDLARRITLVVRTDKNVLTISIVNRFLAFPSQKNLTAYLLYRSYKLLFAYVVIVLIVVRRIDKLLLLLTRIYKWSCTQKQP